MNTKVYITGLLLVVGAVYFYNATQNKKKAVKSQNEQSNFDGFYATGMRKVQRNNGYNGVKIQNPDGSFCPTTCDNASFQALGRVS